MRIKMVLAGGLALTAIAVLLALLHSPSTVTATNGIVTTANFGQIQEHERVCQTGETLPAGISTIQLALEAITGPQVDVEVLAGDRVIARGSSGTAWYGTTVRVPVSPLPRPSPHATVCFELSSLTGIVLAHGAPTTPALAARSNGNVLPGRLSVAYLRPARASWLAQAGAVVQHMGLGRAASGSWIVIPIVLLMVVAIALGCRLIVRELT